MPFDRLPMATCTITRPGTTPTGSVSLPSSKSISNRLLIIRHLCDSGITIENLSTAEDTLLLRELLDRIAAVHQRPGEVTIDCGNAGTVMRFLTAYLATKKGSWLVTGAGRMQQRPVGILVDALNSLGSSVHYAGTQGYPPLQIKGSPLTGGEVTIDGSISSQFVSALLLIAPTLPGGLTINLTGKPVSAPYVEMTLRLMEEFGIRIDRRETSLVVKPGRYQAGGTPPGFYSVEADWSSAAFWYEAVALASASGLSGMSSGIRLPGLEKESLQGDARLAELFRPLGVETRYDREGVVITGLEAPGMPRQTAGIRQGAYGMQQVAPGSRTGEIDLSSFPDVAPALIVTYAALGIGATFTGLHHLQIKESNRLEVLETELKRLGIPIRPPASGILVTEENPDSLSTLSNRPTVTIPTYGDHRMAMAFAPLALLTGTIRIENPSVVSKSYPGFWEELRGLGFGVT